MLVYHGTSREHADRFIRDGIDADRLHTRAIHGPQDFEPGLFVTPRFDVARRFGLCVLQIEVELDELVVPPTLRLAGATLKDVLTHPFEPQALLVPRVSPCRVTLIESHLNEYPFNPFDETIPPQGVQR